jgi:hypothetical protein
VTTTQRSLLIPLLVSLLVAATPPPVHAQDYRVPQRQPVICTATNPYPYYQASPDANHAGPGWYCSPVSVRLMTGAGLVDSTSTASGTVQSTEYTLNSVTVPANAFSDVNKALRCGFWGTGAANANAKNYKVYLGASAIATLTGTTDSGKDYYAELIVARTGASTQTAVASITSDVGAVDAFAVSTSAAQTDTAAIVVAFKAANTAAAAASATGKGAACWFIN